MNTRPKHLPGPTVRTPRVATLFGVQYQCQYQYQAVFPRKHPSEIFNRLPPAPSRGSAPSATSSVAPSYAEHLGGLQGSADRTSSPRAKRPGKLKLGLGWEYLGIWEYLKNRHIEIISTEYWEDLGRCKIGHLGHDQRLNVVQISWDEVRIFSAHSHEQIHIRIPSNSHNKVMILALYHFYLMPMNATFLYVDTHTEICIHIYMCVCAYFNYEH